MKRFLGIDQGGTKTEAVLCDENGTILGNAITEGLVTVYTQDTHSVYIRNIRDAAKLALAQGGDLELEDVDAVCGCLNGADWSFEYVRLAVKLRQAVACRDVTLINDCIGGMRGGSDQRQCAVVAVGTGLNAAVRRDDGEKIIYGYYIVSQDQGASALGRAVVGKVWDAHGGLCGPTVLTELLLRYTGDPDVEAMTVRHTVGGEALVHKNLVQLLLEALRLGDDQALEVAVQFADRVALYIAAGIRKLGLEREELPVVFTGSVLKDNGVLLAELILGRMEALGLNVRAVNARYEPVCGAALTLLDRHWGGNIPSGVMAEFDRTALERGLVRDLVPRPLTFPLQNRKEGALLPLGLSHCKE